MNTQRTFDPLQQTRLGKYIYALRDPRDRKIFYIGQGTGNRIFDHFSEADGVNPQNINLNIISNKTLRILEIWDNDYDVDWLILAHGLSQENNEMADHLESGLYDCLTQSINGALLNENIPPRSSLLLQEDVIALGADFVNPTEPIQNVFIFPIHVAVNTGATPYDATRRAWSVSQIFRILKPSNAVGLVDSISRGSFAIDQWIVSPVALDRFEFLSPGHPNPINIDSLLNKNWTNILSVVKGHWLWGNYIIVDFDGNGHYRIKKGSEDKTTWYNCIP